MIEPRPERRFAAGLLALLRRRAPAVGAFIVLMMLFDATRSWSMSDMPYGFLEGMMTAITVNWTLILVGTLAPYLLEEAHIPPVSRAVLSVLVTFLLVALVAIGLDFLWEGPLTPGVRDRRLLSNEAFLVRSWWLYSVAGLLFAAYCQIRDREIATLRAARTAELERADSQRDIMASRLQVLQARVEPELLFDALGDVRRAYLRDPAAAESLLDDLIAYLRAALPQMRGGMSTLQREAALAEAYLKVVPSGRSGDLVVDVCILGDAGTTPFPPMVLLPLAHAASDASSPTIRIVAPATGPGAIGADHSVAMRMAVSHVPEGWAAPRLVAIRGALQNYFGADASLQVECEAASVSVVIAWRAAASPGSRTDAVAVAPV